MEGLECHLSCLDRHVAQSDDSQMSARKSLEEMGKEAGWPPKGLLGRSRC